MAPPPRPGEERVAPVAASRAARDAVTLGLAGVALLAIVALMARLPDWPRHLGAFQGLYLLAFVPYALALTRLAGRPAGRHGLAIVLTVALAARLALLAAPPALSDDIYRYVWEGRVLLHGGNPWTSSPDDPELAALRDPVVHPAVNHPGLATIYPPLAEAGFALVAAVSPTVAAMKLWVILHDLALVALLGVVLGRAGRDPAWAAAYAWNPLVLVEYAASGHNDPTAMVWLMAAIVASRSRPLLSAAALAAGTLVKVAPLLALPLLWRGWPWRARALALALLVPGLGAFAWLTRGANSGLHAYWGSWRNNALVFELLERWTRSFDAARLVAGALVLALVARALIRGWNPTRAARAAYRGAFLVSPVAHPWYQGWFLMFEPWAPGAPWLLLSATAVLNYGVFAPPAEGRDFHLSLPWRVVEYGAPAMMALGLAIARARARPGRGAGMIPDPGGAAVA